MYHDYCITGAYISFFVLTSGRPLPVTTFFVFSKPLCSHFAAQIVIREFSAPLQKRCLSLSKGFPLQPKFATAAAQRFYSSFVALLEAILQRCSSAARFVRVASFISRKAYSLVVVCSWQLKPVITSLRLKKILIKRIWKLVLPSITRPGRNYTFQTRGSSPTQAFHTDERKREIMDMKSQTPVQP